jgi:outer membrane protein insertion porin family
MLPRSFALFCALAPAFACPVTAQTFTPQKIVFTGAPNLNQAALTKVFGIAPGKPITADDIQPALQRLSDTGLFADMHYLVDSRSLTVNLTPQPAKNLLPTVYSNFVLFAPGQLTPLVQARVPLFTGDIPVVGNLQQSVQDALAAILQEKGFSGATVDSIGHSDQPGGPITAIAFSISNPPVEVRSLHVENVSPIAQAKVDEIAKAFAGNPYERGSEDAVRSRLEDAYKDLAFLDIAIDPPTRSASSIEPTRIAVDLATAAHEGAQYRLVKLVLPVTPIVSADELAKAAALKPGDLATRIGLLATASHIDRQFTRRGYMDAKFSANTQKDPATHTVIYTLAVVPGEQYRIKSVKALNLNPEQQKDFESAWKLTPGSPYDEDYVASFLHKNTALKSLAGYSASYKQIGDPATHLVELTLTFVKGGVLVRP